MVDDGVGVVNGNGGGNEVKSRHEVGKSEFGGVSEL